MKLYAPFLFLLLFSFGGCDYFNTAEQKETGNIKKGDAYFGKGDVENAVVFWEKAIQEKRTEDLYEKLIMGNFIKKDLHSAYDWSKEGLSYFPESHNLIFNLALIQYHKEKYEEALLTFDRLLAVNAYFPNANYLKGLIYEKTGEKEKAIRAFVNEVNANPGSRGAWSKIREEGKNVK